MVHREPSEGKKRKPRGRPFPKGNKRGKLEDDVLDASGHESGDEGGIITPLTQSAGVEALKQSYDELENQDKETLKELVEGPKEGIGCLAPGATIEGGLGISLHEQIPIKNPIENAVIESIEFLRGKDTMKIVLLKRHNRMYRIQIFLNDSEIRPNTYTGASSAMAFWNLLKGSLKNER